MDYELNSETYPIGTMIANRYEIVQFLAAGGMAQVYIARQQLVDRLVAVKVLSAAFSMNPGVVKRFFREAKVIGALENQENTVRIYDMGETDDKRLFIAMELLKGEELSERIRREPLSPSETFPIVRQVACSLSAAHKRGIIHRDLKPDNIFLTEQGVVKVLDFGIAKLKEDEQSDEMGEKRLTKAGTAPGTPEYMSPEQARGKELDARSDLYSLGIVIYEMLCGHPPFEEATFLGTILLHIQSPPPPLPESLPLPLRNYIINRMLAKDPNCRPDNADVFLAEWDDLSKKLKLGKNETDESESELSRAQAEIEALRSRLAKTEMELMRSGEPGTNLDNPAPDSSEVSALPETADAKPAESSHEPKEKTPSSASHSGIGRCQIPARARRAMARPPLAGGARVSEHGDRRESSQLGATGHVGGQADTSNPGQSSLGHAGASNPGQSSLGHAGASNPGQSSLGHAGASNPGQSSLGHAGASNPGQSSFGSGGMPSLGQPPLGQGGMPGLGQPASAAMGNHVPGMGPQGGMYPSGGMGPQGGMYPSGGMGPQGGMYPSGGMGPQGGMYPHGGMGPQTGMSGSPMGGVMPSLGGGMPNAMGGGPMSGVMPALGGGMPNAMGGGMSNAMNSGTMSGGPMSGVMPALGGGMPHSMGGGMPNAMNSGAMSGGPMSGVMPALGGGMPHSMGGGPMSGMPHSMGGGMPNAMGSGSMGGMPHSMGGSPMSGGMSNAMGSGAMSGGPMSMQMSGVMPTSAGGSMSVRLSPGGYGAPIVDDEFHEPVVPPQPRHGMPGRGTSGTYGRMPSEHNMPRVPDGMRRSGMPERPSEHNTPRVPDGMRRVGMPGSEHGRHSGGSERGLGLERPEIFDKFSLDEDSGMSRPRDSLTGMTAIRKSSSQGTPEVVFMSFAQPLCNKLGPEKVEEALELAKSVWNATVEGDDAVAVLFESAEGAENLRKMLDILVSRKERYFSEETWSIRSLKVDRSDDGRLSIRLATIQPM